MVRLLAYEITWVKFEKGREEKEGSLRIEFTPQLIN